MLLNHDAGFEYVKKLVGLKYKISMVTKWNKGRHLLIQCMNDKDQFIYFYCLFKHTTFHSFNAVFKRFVEQFPEFEGHGESINVEFLEYARVREATLLYIYPDGKIYSIESKLVYNFCNKNGLSRTQDRRNEYLEAWGNGAKAIIQEKEYVFPIKLMARYY
jgi:hypothetical protein